MSKIKLIAFDLDGTLTQHKTPLDPVNKAVLDRLREKYVLLMVGAGASYRIFNQMGKYPIDVFGNYGLQLGDHITCDGDRINKVLRMSAMAAFTDDLDRKDVTGCADRTFLYADLSTL